MPRYFFHIKDKALTILDDEGIELDGLDEAREEAAEIRQVMSAQVHTGQAEFVVTDEQERTVPTFPFKLALE